MIENFKIIHELDVLVECEFKDENKSESGLFLGKTSKISERPKQGKVLQIGSDVKNIKIGDTVVFTATVGIDLELKDNKWYILLNTDKILGVIDNAI